MYSPGERPEETPGVFTVRPQIQKPNPDGLPHPAPLDSALVYYNVIRMEEVLTLRLPKGSRRRLTQLAKRKRQNLSQYVRHAIESQLWIDALDETVVLAAPKAAALGLKTDDDVFRLFS